MMPLFQLSCFLFKNIQINNVKLQLNILTFIPEKQEFLSFYRSCGQVSIGNECVTEWNGFTCRGSCQGDFCNEDEIGNRSPAYASMISNACQTSVQSAVLVLCGLMSVYI